MTLQEIYTAIDNFVTIHEILSPFLFVIVMFWFIFIITLIVNRKALIEDLEWHN